MMLSKTQWWNFASIAAVALLCNWLVGCGKSEVTLKGREDALAAKSLTASGREVIFPDATPSVPDGKIVYEKLNCAQCHGPAGEAVGGKATVNLADKTWGHKQKPVDQYEFLFFGKPGTDHPILANNNVVSRHDVWDLVFYVRSLSQPLLSDTDTLAVDAVFGSNCAVCHGKKGYGDGPLSKNLEPMPANFQNKERFYDRSDDVLWDHIAHGIRWEGMPNFLGNKDTAKDVTFDEAYIWKLVQYVRHFHETNEGTIAAGKAEAPASK